jgi:hypothetical protein
MLTTTILLTITIVSLILTIALAALVVKLTRDERRRSAARVAALTRMADTAAEEPDFSFELDETDDDDLTFDRLDQASRPGDLFAAHEQRDTHSEWPHRLGIVVAVAIIVAIATIAVRWRSTTIAPSTTTERVAGSAPSAQAPGLLELMSLKHTQDATTLTITGIVQNPRDGVPLTKVAATAFLFRADGSLIANGRAPLDFTLLRPGDESAFTISVPVSTAVARYRVGFRGEDGRIIGHVDRRGGSTIATLTFDRLRLERGPS